MSTPPHAKKPPPRSPASGRSRVTAAPPSSGGNKRKFGHLMDKDAISLSATRRRYNNVEVINDVILNSGLPPVNLFKVSMSETNQTENTAPNTPSKEASFRRVEVLEEKLGIWEMENDRLCDENIHLRKVQQAMENFYQDRENHLEKTHKEQMTKLQNDVDSRDIKIKELESTVRKQAEQIEEQTENIKMLEEEQEAQTQKINMLEEENKAQAHKINMLEEENKTQAQKINMLGEENKMQAQQINDLQNAVQELQRQISSMGLSLDASRVQGGDRSA